jgi:hypothetical protein
LLAEQVCDTVSELGVTLSDDSAPGGTHWPELLPALNNCIQSGNPAMMEAGLSILGGFVSHKNST